MDAEQTTRPAQELAGLAARARAWSRALRADSVKLASQVAETEEALAKTLAYPGSQHPRPAAKRADRQLAGRQTTPGGSGSANTARHREAML
jgi:hypothetical protein